MLDITYDERLKEVYERRHNHHINKIKELRCLMLSKNEDFDYKICSDLINMHKDLLMNLNSIFTEIEYF